MLKLTLLEIVLRGIPEDFVLIFAMYAFSKTTINIKRYIISSIFSVIIIYLIRLLPIQFGVHTIIGIIAIIVITININKIPIIKCVQASVMAFILEITCEGISIFIMQDIFGLDINSIFKEPTLKILYGIPSLLVFACVVILYYFRSSRKGELRDAINGEISF